LVSSQQKRKEGNAPLFRNHKPLKIPDPKKVIKFIPQTADPPPWPPKNNMIIRSKYKLQKENDIFWIKNYDDRYKIFILAKENNFQKMNI
jgi:hypothetical protein